MSTATYTITYIAGDQEKTFSVQLTNDQIIGMRTLLAAIPTLNDVYDTPNNAFYAITRDKDILHIRNSSTDEVILSAGSDQLSNQDSTITQIKLMENPNVGVIDELEFVDAFGDYVSPRVIVTDSAVDRASDVSVDTSIGSTEEAVTLLSFDNKDGSNTVLIRSNGKPGFESGILYVLKLLVTVYNLNYGAKMDLPTIYSLQLSKPTKLTGFAKSSDFDIEATTRLQY